MSIVDFAADQAAPRRRRSRRQPDGFATVPALAAVGPLGLSALYGAIRRGELPAHRWRGHLVVRRNDFDVFLEAEPVPVAACGAGPKQNNA